MNKLILASASPRRRELLKRILPAFDVRVSPREELRDKPAGVRATEWAESLAHFKARAVAEQAPERWVLGADTVVACGGEILGKPRDLADARRMLHLQAGRACDVITGVCLLRLGGTPGRDCRAETTRVWMRGDLAEIEVYLASGDWQGKAGAYGIQTVGDRLVERFEGSFSNVIGLPLDTVGQMLRRVPELSSFVVFSPRAESEAGISGRDAVT